MRPSETSFRGERGGFIDQQMQSHEREKIEGANAALNSTAVRGSQLRMRQLAVRGVNIINQVLLPGGGALA